MFLDKTNGVSRPVLFIPVELNYGSFSPFVQFIWSDLNTAIVLRCKPKQPYQDPSRMWSKSGPKQTLKGLFVLGYDLTSSSRRLPNY